MVRIRLNEYVNRIPQEQIISTLTRLLDQPTDVKISWWADYEVFVRGYQGTMLLSDLRAKFLSANSTEVTSYAHLKGKIEQLETRATEVLKKVSCFYRCFCKVRSDCSLRTEDLLFFSAEAVQKRGV